MSRSTAATAMADSVLTYAQQRVGTGKESPESSLDRALVHAFALTETLFHFALSCPLPLESAAREKVVHVFEITIGDLIDKGQMGWLDESVRRPFVLQCAEYLGEAAFKSGKAAGIVTARNLDDAACAMVHDKKAQCPLYSDRSGENIFGSCCEVLVVDLRCELKAMNESARR